MAEIHPQLLGDCLLLGRFTMCHLLLMQDANYPWFVLVPDRQDVSEIYELSREDQIQLIDESAVLSSVIKEQFNADKLNIAALGNIVPQLHVHHVARFKVDPAWPAPVWGKCPARPYTADQREDVITRVRLKLKDAVEFYI